MTVYTLQFTYHFSNAFNDQGFPTRKSIDTRCIFGKQLTFFLNWNRDLLLSFSITRRSELTQQRDQLSNNRVWKISHKNLRWKTHPPTSSINHSVNRYLRRVSFCDHRSTIKEAAMTFLLLAPVVVVLVVVVVLAIVVHSNKRQYVRTDCLSVAHHHITSHPARSLWWCTLLTQTDRLVNVPPRTYTQCLLAHRIHASKNFENKPESRRLRQSIAVASTIIDRSAASRCAPDTLNFVMFRISSIIVLSILSLYYPEISFDNDISMPLDEKLV